jgi:hypothetical protein
MQLAGVNLPPPPPNITGASKYKKTAWNKAMKTARARANQRPRKLPAKSRGGPLSQAVVRMPSPLQRGQEILNDDELPDYEDDLPDYEDSDQPVDYDPPLPPPLLGPNKRRAPASNSFERDRNQRFNPTKMKRLNPQDGSGFRRRTQTRGSPRAGKKNNKVKTQLNAAMRVGERGNLDRAYAMMEELDQHITDRDRTRAYDYLDSQSHAYGF